MEFLTNLLTKYSELNIPSQFEHISKIDSNISWYLADQNKQLITIKSDNSKNIIELDIVSAFPTICHLLYDKDSEFIKVLDNIKNKKERNIHIATTLSSKELQRLNYICKCVIMGTFLSNCNPDEDIILEIKKDGLIIACCNETLFNITNMDSNPNPFTNFVVENGFKFHINQIYKYIRTNRTSWILNNDFKYNIKGLYKYLPKYLEKIVEHILFENLNKIDFNKLKEIYSKRFCKILLVNNIMKLIKLYYICKEDSILDTNRMYVKFTRNRTLDPIVYLQTFVFPILISSKL